MKKIFKIEILVFLIILSIILSFLLFEKNKEKQYREMKPFEAANSSAWFVNNRIIGHAGGGIEHFTHTNSKEAIENTISAGINIIEIDFNLTSDGKIACYHLLDDAFWPVNKFPTAEEFKNIKIQGKFTPILIQDIFTYMEDNPDLYIAIDTKHDSISEIVQKIVDSCENKKLLNRFLIQCFYPGDKKLIEKIYDFPEENYIFANYKYSTNPYDSLEVCYKEGIQVVIVPLNIWSKEEFKMFKDKNIYVYAHTINRIDVANEVIDRGAYGIYTDYLFDYEIKE